MKLFKKHDRVQAEMLERNVFVSFGRNLEDGKSNGGYVRLELPISRSREVLDPTTFNTRRVKCRPTLFFMWRTPKRATRYALIKSFIWFPMD